jgi:poly [ADP-ribose] polymerase
MSDPKVFRKFILMDPVDNHNKLWQFSWYDNPMKAVVEWGRVGASLQRKEFPGMSQYGIEAKALEKTRKGYTELELHTPQPVAQIQTSDPQVQKFVQWVFSAAGEYIKSYLSVGVDALSQEQIEKGRRLLQEIQESTKLGSKGSLLELVKEYYNTIPTQLPRKIEFQDIIAAICKNLSEQEDRLNQMEAALSTYVAPGSSTTQYAALGAQITALAQTEQAYGQIVDFIAKTARRAYNRISGIFLVEIPGERQRFAVSPYGKTNVVELFHGTPTRNIRHILKSGLIIPGIPANGARFGKGIYFADQSNRSLNYTNSPMGIPRMLFITEVALGKPKKLSGDDSSLRQAPPGYDSVWGVQSYGGMDEFIVYRPEQQTIRAVVTLEV